MAIITGKIILCILSAALVACVIAQPSQSDGLSSSIAGGAEQLFGKKRSKPYEKILHRLTIVLSVLILAASLLMTIFIGK